MPLRWGPGPVFVHESIAATRRWQLYAMRSFFVFSLLAALVLVWLVMSVDDGQPVGSISIKKLAQAGEYFFYAISTTQLMLVLLVAPAATAGAICLDRARGSLTHMLVTDLGDGEIVLGKLAARFLPVVGLVAATIPVLALAGLLGGVIFEAIVSLTLVTLALAVLGCTLALAISVRATKTHEVLMAVYAIELVWVLGPLVWGILTFTRVLPGVPRWFVAINPFVLACAPYVSPNRVSWESFAGALGGMMVISVVLVAYTVLRLRAEVTRAAGSRLTSWLERANAQLLWWRPGPSLDNDPVLWREWRRGRPSRLTRVVWGLFIALSLAGMATGIVTIVDDYRTGSEFLKLVSGLHATLGLLIVSLFSPTVLAEERVRGSLDVLMTTPLPTDRIVLSKWWGAYRVVPALAFLPAITCLIITAGAPDHALAVLRSKQTPAPLDALDRIAYVFIPVAMLLAQGAVVTSVGLALATWIPRVGRAVAVSVTSCAFFAIGWVPLIEVGGEILVDVGLWPESDVRTLEFLMYVVGAACPMGGQYFTFVTASWPAADSRLSLYIAQVIVLLATIGIALGVLALTLLTFDRCVGRMSERPRRAPRPPRRAAIPPAPRVRRPVLPNPVSVT
jgi:ABC-type transport system involved in multi-copper enzyme maturation permease subunit